MNITVYLGANSGNDPVLGSAVTALGTWIGSAGHTLVYGGSESGLMGMLAKAVMKAGGRVIGVEPKVFVDAGLMLDGITQLIVTEDFPERRKKMMELGDAFIAFPGGTGTLDEITEVMAAVYLGHMHAPCILYDLNSYYAGMRQQLSHAVEMGLSHPEQLSPITFAKDLSEIIAAVNAQ